MSCFRFRRRRLKSLIIAYPQVSRKITDSFRERIDDRVVSAEAFFWAVLRRGCTKINHVGKGRATRPFAAGKSVLSAARRLH
jgi:hypothetical protein